MSSVSLVSVVTIAWVVVTGLYLVLFLYRSLVGMREEDTLYLSAGESRMAAEQHELMKRITRLDRYSRTLGWAALAMTVVLGGVWGYDAMKQFL